ncbi:MAG: SGNH/GDSL hydrolase family protein [Ruminiclostridium sp.]|nr:SGNH/GDSL hydrolase family protein [Ruminiclostridium sp.]
MKNKLTLILLTAALLISAASCGGNTSPSATTVSDTTTAAAPAASDSSADTAPAAPETTAPTETAAPAESVKTIPEDSEYVIENGITERMKALSVLNEGNRARLAKAMKKALNGEPLTVAYFGGSITQGSSAGNDLCYARLTTDWFEKTFPNSKITYVNAGIGATGSYIGVYRADRDVTCKNPDIVFVDFSVNDTTEHTQRNIASYDGVMRKLWFSESSPAIVTIAMTMENGTSFQQYHSEIAEAYDIPMISYHDAILDVIANGHIVWDDISDDDIHPNIPGHAVLTEMITSYLQGVLDDLDSIDTEAESDLSVPFNSDKYSTATLVVPGSPENTVCKGWDIKQENFGNFGDCWRIMSKDGNFDGIEPLTFEVEAKSIGVFYGKMTAKGGTFDVVVDGNIEKTINSDFKGGWGSYVEAEEIIDFDECGRHTVEIVPHTGEKSVFTISALALTK